MQSFHPNDSFILKSEHLSHNGTISRRDGSFHNQKIQCTRPKSAVSKTNRSISTVSMAQTESCGESSSSGTPDSCEMSLKMNSFEVFILKTIEKQFKKAMKTKEQISVALMFTCTSSVAKDYCDIVRLYESGKIPNTDVASIHLHASSHVVHQFVNLVDSLKKSDILAKRANDEVSYSRTPSQVVFTDMEAYLQKMFQKVSKSASPLQAAKLLCWYENFVERIEGAYPNSDDIKPSYTWQSSMKVLMDRYLQLGVKKNLNNIDLDKNDTDVLPNDDGHLFTNFPEVIMDMVDVQLSIADEYLPDKYIPEVLGLCIEVIVQISSNKMKMIQSEDKGMSAKMCCAVINDVNRLNGMLASRCEKVMSEYVDHDFLESTHQISKIEEAGKEIERCLVGLEHSAIGLLCKHLQQDLSKMSTALLISIGDQSWECDSSGSIVSSSIDLLLQHVKNVAQVLMDKDFFLVQSHELCYDTFLQGYVESFYLNTMCCGIQKLEKVASQLDLDYQKLVEVANLELSYESDTSQKIMERLRVIRSISRIVNPSNPPSDSLIDEVQIILKSVSTERKEDVACTVLHLAGLKNPATRSDVVAWISLISTAQLELAAQNSDGRSCNSFCSIKQCDLINSPFIYRLRVSQEEIDNHVFGPIKSHAQILKELIEDGFQMLLAQYQKRKSEHDAEEQSKRNGFLPFPNLFMSKIKMRLYDFK